MKRLTVLAIFLIFAAANSIFAASQNDSINEFDEHMNKFEQHMHEVEESLDEFQKSRDELYEATHEFEEPIEALSDSVAESEGGIYTFEGDVVAAHKFEMGTEYSHIRYEEPDVMKEEGNMYGISGSYWCRDKHKNEFKLETKYSWGTVDYSSPISGTQENQEDRMFEIRGLGGRAFYPSEIVTLTPYIGLGYRLLYDDARGTTSVGHKGYERISNYYYMPLGLEANAKLSGKWSVGTTLEYDFFIKGQQESRLSQAIAGLNDIKNDQKEGFGARGSLRIQKQTEKIDFLIEPFVKYWDIKESELTAITYSGFIIGYGYEPKNDSLEYGGKFAIRF